jgi:phage FluMu protein Com
MESCEATCPKCGQVNHITGFSEVTAFRCQFCGEGVAL